MLWSHIARRYMFSPKSHSTINIIAAVSIIAVAIPTAAMIILLSMFNGLSSTIEELYSTIDADMEIVANEGQTFRCSAIDRDAIGSIEGISSMTFYLEQSVILSANGRRSTVQLRGIDTSYTDVFSLDSHIQYGNMKAIDRGDILLGSIAAGQISAHNIGCEIEMFALNRKQVSTVLPMSGISHLKTHLGGIVITNADIDATLALISLPQAQQLLNYKDRVTTIALKTTPNADIEELRGMVQSMVGDDFRVITRNEKHASMNDIINMERFVIILIGSLIALVATFAMVGSVVMLIAILKSMGASESLVRKIFTGEGMMLCGIGCAIGIAIGLTFCLLQQQLGIIRMPAEMVVEYYPVDIELIDTLLVAGVILCTGLLVTYISVKATLNRNRLQR